MAWPWPTAVCSAPLGGTIPPSRSWPSPSATRSGGRWGEVRRSARFLRGQGEAAPDPSDRSTGAHWTGEAGRGRTAGPRQLPPAIIRDANTSTEPSRVALAGGACSAARTELAGLLDYGT